MKLRIYSSLLVVWLYAVLASSQTNPVPSEENCRTAITLGLDQLRIIPPDINQRDNEDRKKLLAEMECLVATNRLLGISECRTWTDILGKAFKQ